MKLFRIYKTKCRSDETDFNETDENNQFWDMPNLIGIKRKNEQKVARLFLYF